MTWKKGKYLILLEKKFSSKIQSGLNAYCSMLYLLGELLPIFLYLFTSNIKALIFFLMCQ